MTQPNTPNAPPFLAWLNRNRSLVGYALLALAALAVAGGVTVGVRSGWTNSETVGYLGWFGAVAALLGLAGLWQLGSRPSAEGDLRDTRQAVVAVGGLFGLLLAGLGVGVAVAERVQLIDMLKNGLSDDTKPAWIALGSVTAVFLGLFLSFVSLAINRTEERSDPTLRRLMYGYNAVVSGVLLLLVLTAGNVLAYMTLPNLLDFTASGANSLDPNGDTAKVLKSLDRKITVYMFLDEDENLTADWTRVLLTNFQDAAGSDKITVKQLPADLKNPELRELKKQYKFGDEPGLLLVAPGETEQGTQSTFIRQSDLISFSPGMSGGDRRQFNYVGESKLLSEIVFLGEGKVKPVVYVTQGHGELDLNDSRADRPDTGLGVLRDKLSRRNFEVKPLTFEGTEPKVPDDATAVAVIGPTRAFPEPALAALRAYLKPPAASGKKPGKLLAMLSGEVNRDTGKFPVTGLEPLLRESGVELPEERITSYVQMRNIGGRLLFAQSPSVVYLQPATAARDNPAVADLEEVVADGVRVVRGQAAANPHGAPPAPGPKATPLLTTEPSDRPAFADTDLKRSPAESLLLKLQAVTAGEASQDEFRKPIPAAVAVADGDGKDAQPRMVVFGTPSLVSNYRMQPEGTRLFQLVAGSLDWLRGRQTFSGIAPRTRPVVTLDGPNPYGSLPWQPLFVMLMGVLALGGGVWIVRRR
jgi:hypothetical protein